MDYPVKRAPGEDMVAAAGRASRRPGAGSPEGSADPSGVKRHWRGVGLRGPSDCGFKLLLTEVERGSRGPREVFRGP